jgi:hypothetical protein
MPFKKLIIKIKRQKIKNFLAIKYERKDGEKARFRPPEATKPSKRLFIINFDELGIRILQTWRAILLCSENPCCSTRLALERGNWR